MLDVKLFIVTLIALYISSRDQAGVQAQADDVVGVAIKNKFDTLVSLVKKAELATVLKGEGPFTVFAPTEEAFKNLPTFLVDKLMEDEDLLKGVLLAHVVPGKVKSTDLSDGLEADTALKDFKVKFMIGDDGAFVNGAKIGPADVEASNGIVHVIDKVINPMEGENIVNIAKRNGFKALVALVGSVGLKETLMEEGLFTVFAPTDEAFKSLPSSMVSKIRKNPYILKKILMAHVLPGEVYSKDLKDGAMANTLLQPFKVEFEMDDDVPEVNDAAIIQADIKAMNGVVHVINKVINPFDSDSYPEPEPEYEPEPEPGQEPEPEPM